MEFALSRKRVSWTATGLLIVATGLGGCGGKSAVKTSTSAHVQAEKATPAYRVGQYCLPSREAKYRAAGLTCTRHHLARG
jgi:hypothetical protein